MQPVISIGFAYKLQAFWQEWNIRIFVLLSEFLQLILYFLMPYRKRTSNTFILLLINATYIVSFLAAGMALAYISSGMPDRNGYQPPLVLWASFMLLHLAGVGQTIAQTVDDSKMWYKRFFNFLFNDLVIFVVICLQWHQVAVPGGWAFIAMAAYLGSFLQMKLLWLGRSDSRVEHLLPDSLSKGHSTSVHVEATPQPTTTSVNVEEESPRRLKEFDLVNKAFEYYHISRKLIPGLSFTITERKDSRSYFLWLEPEDAVRIVEIELNLAYDAYFTNGFDPPKNKYHRGRYLLLRLIYHSCVLALFTTIGVRISFLSLSDLEDKYNDHDKLITRLLCFSTVLLNLLALLKFLFSDYVVASWEIRRLAKLPHKRRWRPVAPRYTTNMIHYVICFVQFYLTSLARTFFRRWSETISRRSFMIECMREATMTSTRLPRIFLQRYVTPPTSGTQWYNKEVGTFIFTQLQKKARSSEDDEWEVFGSKGDWVLLKNLPQPPYKEKLHLPASFLYSPYDLRLLLWHIATEILYDRTSEQPGNEAGTNQCREMSNLLSEYMMYLTFDRRRIMSGLRGNFIVRYRDVSRYIEKNWELVKWYEWSKKPPLDRLSKFYRKIVGEYRREIENEENGNLVNGVIKEPVILEAVKIAVELNNLESKEMWEVVSEVWVDLLAYAATHCDPLAHVQRLAEGGELITIVWLLSAHLGFGDYFLPTEESQPQEEDKGQFTFSSCSSLFRRIFGQLFSN